MPPSQRVAIVDDDPGVRGSIVSLLRSVGLTGVPFADGGALLDSPHLEAFACIVTDVHMDGVDGPALQTELRRRGCAAPLIVMTAFPTATTRQQMLAAGARAFLTKPIDPDTLLEAIEDAVA